MTLTEHLIYDTLLPIVLAILASSGFWAYILSRTQSREKVDELRQLQTELLIGLAHDKISYLGMKYIGRGYITNDEYENLHLYLYKPYKEMGGNGSAERIMKAVDELPIVAANYEKIFSSRKGDSKNVSTE